MYKKWGLRDAAAFGAACLVIVWAVLYLINKACHWTGWLSAEQWAAWVQAVGSIVTIVLTVGVVQWQHSHAAKQDLARHAAEIARELTHVLALLESAAGLLEAFHQSLRAGEQIHETSQGRLRVLIEGLGQVQPSEAVSAQAFVLLKESEAALLSGLGLVTQWSLLIPQHVAPETINDVNSKLAHQLGRALVACYAFRARVHATQVTS